MRGGFSVLSAFDLYDFTRLDHFIGFTRSMMFKAVMRLQREAMFWAGTRSFPCCVPALWCAAIDCRRSWFHYACGAGSLAETGIPGMSVAVFSNQDPREHFEANLETIVYTSTHDTPTL